MNDSGAARPMIARRMCALALALTLLAGLVGCAPETPSAPGAPGVDAVPLRAGPVVGKRHVHHD